MSREILILLGFLFLILFLSGVSAADMCWVELNSADCANSNGKVVMSLSDETNAHGALAGQGTFAPVLCCNFGEGDTTCTVDNNIIGLSSSTNAHAEIPDLASPNYNNDVCYDSLKDCRRTTDSCSVAMDETAVLYLSSGEAQLYTNAHIEEAGLQDQNYDLKICCVVEYPEICDLTSAKWQYEEVMEETDVGAIVNGTGCSEGEEISFEVFRGSTSCDDIDGCENPLNVTFVAGSNSVTGTWTAGPYHDNEYYLVVRVVANPDETVTSSEPDLLVISECPYDPEPVICGDYTNVNSCNSNICEIDVQDSVPSYVDCSDPDIDCWCIWENDECKAGWDGTDGGYCGDGSVDRPNIGGMDEQCDPDLDTPVFLSGEDSCVALTTKLGMDDYTGGSLDCASGCTFDITSCIGPAPICGDNVVNQLNETCDGIDLNGWTCETLGYGGGTLGCDSSCALDASSCTNPSAKICGDGNIDKPNNGNINEQCDPNYGTPVFLSGEDSCVALTTNLGMDTYTSGSLSCKSNCVFDITNCIGATPICGDGVVNVFGEVCDGGDLQGKTCSYFGYSGGSLSCTDCQFDTSECIEPEDSEVGTCIYTQFTDDTCDDDGRLTFNWTAEFVWAEGCGDDCQIANADKAALCDKGERTVECPAQIPLPFFNIYSFVATLSIIALIYVILILRKEKRKR